MPEVSFRQGKNEPHGRAFLDDLLLLDTADSYRILAARGAKILRGKPLGEVYRISAAAKRTMQKPFLPTDTYRVLSGGSGASLLLFPQLLDPTGLLVAVRIPLPPVRLAEYISLVTGTDLLSPFSLRREQLRTTVPAKLEELFYYANRIFLTEEQVSLHTLLQLIANFTGCCLGEIYSVPMLPISFSGADWRRLIAFLLCAFLTIRRRSGIVTALGCNSDALRDDGSPAETAKALLLRLQQEHLRRFPWAEDDPSVDSSVNATKCGDGLFAPDEADAKAPGSLPDGEDPQKDILYFADHPAFRPFVTDEAPDGTLVFDMPLDPSPAKSPEDIREKPMHLYLLLKPEDPLLDPANIALF